MNMTATQPLIEAPASDRNTRYETLGYVNAYDAVLNCDYAFVARKETSRDSGEWRLRIRSSQTAGAVFEPAMMRNQARSTGAQGKPWFQWGYSFDPAPVSRATSTTSTSRTASQPRSKYACSFANSTAQRTKQNPCRFPGQPERPQRPRTPVPEL